MICLHKESVSFLYLVLFFYLIVIIYYTFVGMQFDFYKLFGRSVRGSLKVFLDFIY
jgi:hypothetical protein